MTRIYVLIFSLATPNGNGFHRQIRGVDVLIISFTASRDSFPWRHREALSTRGSKIHPFSSEVDSIPTCRIACTRWCRRRRRRGLTRRDARGNVIPRDSS